MSHSILIFVVTYYSYLQHALQILVFSSLCLVKLILQFLFYFQIVINHSVYSEGPAEILHLAVSLGVEFLLGVALLQYLGGKGKLWSPFVVGVAGRDEDRQNMTLSSLQLQEWHKLSLNRTRSNPWLVAWETLNLS